MQNMSRYSNHGPQVTMFIIVYETIKGTELLHYKNCSVWTPICWVKVTSAELLVNHVSKARCFIKAACSRHEARYRHCFQCWKPVLFTHCFFQNICKCKWLTVYHFLHIAFYSEELDVKRSRFLYNLPTFCVNQA